MNIAFCIRKYSAKCLLKNGSPFSFKKIKKSLFQLKIKTNETPRRASSLKLLSVSDKQRGIFIGISSSSSRFVADLPLRSYGEARSFEA